MHDYDLSDPLQQSDLACQYNGQPTRWHRRKDGSLFPVEITASHFKWQNTEVHLAAIRDITDRIRLEDSLKTQNQILESAQRELEQTNLDLIRSYAELKETQAKVMQQEKMVSIGQLAAGMAHEINNPVGFIISNLGTLAKYASRLKGFIEESLLAVEDSALRASIAQRKAELKIDAILDDIDDLIKESLEGAGRVKRLVLDLKSFSRVDEVEYKHADINECIESTLNIVWNELKYKAKVVKHLSELPQIKCYPQQLNQVFMNILVNAAHAIEKQGTITIATSRAGDEIEIRISDTGCGIAPEIAQRIFEPFFTTKEVGKGTGLGLSITYGIVKKHGGDITVESEPGRGSTFIVKLPIVEER
ncbi:MAG: Sensor protein ZraS [Deltaproteobacteria bacterium ADurb.Bin510]|nr:MAG: Sensor protein ZraS [Deltaproteobacteria bacterium ADurb.Bin510]